MSHLTKKERKRYTDVFREVDSDHDGCLSMSEIEQLCQSLGFTFDDKQIQELFVQMDTDCNGSISLEEFLSVMQPIPRKEKRCATLRRMFKEIDQNGDGVLTLEELHQALSSASDPEDTRQLPMSEVENLIEMADANGDGQLNYEEFINLLKPILK